MLTVSSAQGVGGFHEVNTSLLAAVNDYTSRVMNLEKKMNDEELNGMTILRELKRSR